nr:hypothetical protein BaRGS_009520 [Batillaria attramentaria]
MHCTYFLILTSSIIFTTMAASKLTKEMSSIATSNTQFGFDLFRFCGREQPNQNLFMSPFSISTALALTHLGARGDTAKEMKKVLHWSSDEEIARGFGGYLPLLKQSDGAGYVLVGAQRVYVSKILSVNPDFNKAATQQFSADAQEADFRGNPDVERVNINKWVGDQTRGKVQDLLPSGSITPDTAMVLIQATYFKGKWMHQFNPRLTQKAEFYAPGGTLMVDMMRKEREFHYHHNEELKCAAVELPYMNNTGGDYGHDLNADFTGIANGLSISEVFHKAVVQVNEEGSEAAAATGMVMKRMPIIKPFVADHPFLFFIADKRVNTVLFMGHVFSPASASQAKQEL